MNSTKILAGAGALALATSLAACGSSSSNGASASGHASSSGVSAHVSGAGVSGSVSTSGVSGSVSGASGSGVSGNATSAGSGGGLANDADTLCTQIRTVQNDLGKVSLKKPSSIGSITTDFTRLESAANAVTKANTGSGHSHQLSTVVSDVNAAVKKGQGAFTAVSKGNTNALQSDFNTMGSDLNKARLQAQHTSYAACTASSTGTTGGAGG